METIVIKLAFVKMLLLTNCWSTIYLGKHNFIKFLYGRIGCYGNQKISNAKARRVER